MAIKPQRVGQVKSNGRLVSACLLVLILFALAASLGYAIAEIATSLQAIICTATLLVLWATSTFDPDPKSWFNIVWQYVTPWVIGFAGLVCYPMGAFLGTLANSQIAGIIISILTGGFLSAAAITSVILMGSLLRLTLYQTKAFYGSLQTHQGESSEARKQRRRNTAQALRRQEERSQAEGESALSLFWSVLQGIALAITLVIGSWVGVTGLTFALGWNFAMVVALIGWHNALRKSIRRGPRFLLLLGVLGLGTAVGVLALS